MEILDTLSVGQILERGAQEAPSKIAVVDGERRVTYQELDEMSDALAASLSDLGYSKGDHVAIYMKNSLELVVSFYALQKLGIIVAWVNPNYRRSEVLFILGNSEAKGIFVFREWEGYDYLQALLAIKNDLPELQSIFLAGGGSGPGVYSLKDLVKKGRGKVYSKPEINPGQDLSMLIYTSGTTGTPKGAMICHTQVVKAGYQYALAVAASSEDVFIGFLPMTHSYGCGAVLIQPLLLLATVVIMDKFDSQKAFELIEKERITLQLGAPAHYILELNHPDLKKHDLTSLRAGLIAGQIAPEGLIPRVQKEMNLYLSSFWGASEVGPGLGIACPYPSPMKVREWSIGKPIAGTVLRVVDPETGKEVPDGEIGELTLSGWPVMKGYWKRPDETAKQIRDGWLFMGDLVSKSTEGYIRIYGRTKDLINRGGFKIYPHEIESLIVEHPAVDQACVIATPNPVLGESLCVCVIPKQGRTLSLRDLRAFLKERIAPHKLPDELCVMQDFPRLSGGVKINKFGKGGLAELAKQDPNRERARV